MKKEFNIRRLAIVMLVLAVFSANILSHSYAKFVSLVSGTGQSHAAGFFVINGTSVEQEISNSNIRLAPEESQSFYTTINYFAQTNTEFSQVGYYTSGFGILSDLDSLKETFASFLVSECGYTTQEAAAAITPDSLDDMFEIGVVDSTTGYVAYGSTPAEKFADAIREAGSLSGRGVHVGAMAYDETDYISVSLELIVKWVTITNLWDTFVADRIARELFNNQTSSGINLNIKIRVEQYLNEVDELSTLAQKLWTLNTGVNVSSLVGNIYSINFYSNNQHYSQIEFDTNKITYVKADGTRVVAYNNDRL